jgi:hypothetical protein
MITTSQGYKASRVPVRSDKTKRGKERKKEKNEGKKEGKKEKKGKVE